MKTDHVPETVAEARCFLYRAALHIANRSGYVIRKKRSNPPALRFGLTETSIPYSEGATIRILCARMDYLEVCQLSGLGAAKSLPLYAGRPVEDLLERIAGGINLRGGKELCHVL